MVSLFDNKYYKHGNPKKLVVFVHGYNGSPEAIDYAVQGLVQKLCNAVVVVPRAPEPCEKNPENLQWLSFYQEDPLVRFRQETTPTEEIFDIFNRLGNSFLKVSRQMNLFIDEMQKQFGISDDQTYLMGFSQGAMITIQTALTRKGKLGGAIAVAGIVPSYQILATQIVSKPSFLLLHGQDDATVQYKTFSKTMDWFEANHIPFRTAVFEGLAHRMNEAEMALAAEFINS